MSTRLLDATRLPASKTANRSRLRMIPLLEDQYSSRYRPGNPTTPVAVRTRVVSARGSRTVAVNDTARNTPAVCSRRIAPMTSSPFLGIVRARAGELGPPSMLGAAGSGTGGVPVAGTG